MEYTVTFRNKLSLMTRLAATTAVATGLTLTMQAPAMAASPTVAVTPATGLSDGATVAVTGSGLTPGAVYYAGQCALIASGKFGCDPSTSVAVTADAKGTVSTKIAVHTKFNAVVDAAGTPGGTVDCGVTSCVVDLRSATGDGASQAISFR
jgi:hypothetical protein